MTFDFDDWSEVNNRFDLLAELKKLRPDFKCTLFAVPGLGSEGFWRSTPDYCELAVHGWLHPHPWEAQDWSKDYTNLILDERVVQEFFVTGFKAPGWQISDGTYEALLERGWWVADQHLEDDRRPKDLAVYFYEDGNWHGHVQNVCGNGMEETWPQLCEAVKSAESFEFASEVAA